MIGKAMKAKSLCGLLDPVKCKRICLTRLHITGMSLYVLRLLAFCNHLTTSFIF